MYFYPPPKRQYKGSSMLIMALVSSILLSLIGYSLMKVNSVSFSSFTSSKIFLQAQNYARAKCDILYYKGYEKLDKQAKTEIEGTDFFDEVIVGSEGVLDGNIKGRNITINVYYKDNNLPSYTLDTFMAKAPSKPSGSQIVTGSNGASLIADGDYKTVTVIASSIFNPADGSWTGSAEFNVSVGGSTIGKLLTKTNTYKAGSKGHYWGTTENVSNQITFKHKVAEGQNVSVSLGAVSRHKESTVTLILGN